jgi:hypothetical protein
MENLFARDKSGHATMRDILLICFPEQRWARPCLLVIFRNRRVGRARRIRWREENTTALAVLCGG